MTPDIKRKVELYIVAKLKLALPSLVIVPFTGGDESTDVVDLEPPFTVIGIRDAQKTMATEGTWLCAGNAQVVSYQSEVTSQEHAEMARSVYAALDNIPTVGAVEFSFHGLDIEGMAYAFDEADSAHADIINFTCGVGG